MPIPSTSIYIFRCLPMYAGLTRIRYVDVGMKVATWLPTNPLLQQVRRISRAHVAMGVICESEPLTFECMLLLTVPESFAGVVKVGHGNFRGDGLRLKRTFLLTPFLSFHTHSA